MKQAMLLALAVAAGLYGVGLWAGYQTAFVVGYGALTLMAAMIALTFLWLWQARATPLALGMAFSWAGAACLLGAWWVYNSLRAPEAMYGNEAVFGFLALYFVGAILHFAVVQRSMGLPAGAFAVPVAGALAVSALVRFVM